MNNLIQMEAFVQLCETRSFTEAAKQLHISQSYLSKLIRKLEEEYDILLVSRSGGALTLTKAGEKLYDSCSFILSEYHRLDNTLRLMASNQKEQLSVGITHNAIMANFYDPLKDFIDRYPDIEVNIIEVNPELFKDYLDTHQIDVAIGWYKGRNSKNYEIWNLFSGVWKLCVNAQHPLAAREQVPFHELRDFEFIMSSEDSHRQIMTLKFQKQGFTPKVRHHVAMMYNVLELVERNLGIALIPSTMNTEKFSGIKMIDVTPAFPCSFSMAIRKGDETDAVRVFVDSYTKSIAKKQLTQAK